MADLPPSQPDDLEAPPLPEHLPGPVGTALRTRGIETTAPGRSPGSDDGSVPGADEGAGVSYAWLRLTALVGALVVIGYLNPWMLVVIMAILLMITLHELGHYLTAKRAGMKVTEFFLGFGPKIWSVRRGETEYGIKVIPAGAYVKIPGMVNIDEVAPEDEARTYRQKSFGSRVSVAVAGSAMHFALALVLLYVSAVFVGQPPDPFSSHPVSPPPIIEKVYSGSGAADIGLKPGDRITSVDGKATPTGDALRKAAAPHFGETADITYLRGATERSATIDLGAYTFTLDDGSIGTTCGMGISMAKAPNETVGPVKGLVEAPKQFGQIVGISAKGLASFFSPSGISSFGSQVGSAHQDRETSKEAKKEPAAQTCAQRAAAIAKDPSGRTTTATASSSSSGDNRILSIYGLIGVGSDVGKANPAGLITLFALINVFIGIFNLIPLLPFDGGHVAIAVYENIQEKRLHRRRYFADVTRLLPLTYGVVIVLGLLFVSSLYLDVVNPIS